MERVKRPSTRCLREQARRTAPWTLVEANDKYYARLKVIRRLIDQLKMALRE